MKKFAPHPNPSCYTHTHLGSSRFLEGQAFSHFLEAERWWGEGGVQYPVHKFLSQGGILANQDPTLCGPEAEEIPWRGPGPHSPGGLSLLAALTLAPIPTVPFMQRQPGVEERTLSCV